MPASAGLYPMLLAWFTALDYPHHATARRALAHQVTAVLLAQSLRPAPRMRALLSGITVPARQRFRRAARALVRASLSSPRLTAVLVQAVLTLFGLPRAGLLLALDGVRCGGWEVLVLGVVCQSRVLPVGWAVLPYPWPRGRFTPLTCDLVRQVAAALPPGVRVHLVADRGFPSTRLFRTLQAVGWGWTVRVSARRTVSVAGYQGVVRGLLQAQAPGSWTAQEGSYALGTRAVPGLLVVGRPGPPVLPPHQRGPASRRRRALRQARRVEHISSKHRGPDAARETDPWVVLFTTLATAPQALRTYRRRWAIESSFRDAKGGWDGQHGWDLEPAVARQTSAAAVGGLIGLWALSTLVQTWLGSQVCRGSGPVRCTSRQWTTTQRVSVWARGQLLLQERRDLVIPWLQMTMNRAAARLATCPAPSGALLPAAA